MQTNGFFVLRNALSFVVAGEMKQELDKIAGEICAKDPEAIGNRGRGRYSFGAVTRSGNMLHLKSYRDALVELERTGVVDLIGDVFGIDAAGNRLAQPEVDRSFKVLHSGGDMCLGGCTYECGNYSPADHSHVRLKRRTHTV